MKKFKLLLAAVAAMIGLQAYAWDAPSKPAYSTQWATPTSGQTYYIYNVGAGTFLGGGRAWGTRVVSTIDNIWAQGDAVVSPAANKDYAYPFTLQSNQDGTWCLVHKGTNKGNKYMFYQDGNDAYIDTNADHQNAKWNIVSTENGYRLDMPNKSGKYFGVHATNLVSRTLAYTWSDFADANADKWIYWQFVPESEANAIKNYAAANANLWTLYDARVALYNALLAADENNVSTDEAGAVYTTSSDVTAIKAATTNLQREVNKVRFATLFAGASNDNPIDVTAYCLNNADFSAGNINGWETNYVSGVQADNIGYQGKADGYTNGDVTIVKFIEAWRNGQTLGDGYLRQTVLGLPEGKYLLEADAIATWQSDDSRQITGAQLYIQADGVTYKTDMSTKNEKPQHFTAQFLNTGEGDVVFGLRTVSANCNWLCADNFKVTYYGIDLSPYATLLAQAVAEAQALEGAIPSAAYALVAAAITANNKEYDTSKAYTAAIAAIQGATETAQLLQAPFNKYNNVKNDALAIAANTDVTAADAAADAATEVEGITAAIATLRTAFLAELPNVTIPEGGLDVTAVMVENASVSQSVDGWTVTDIVRMDAKGTGPTTNFGETEFYRSNFKFYQTLALATGTWEFGVTGFHRDGNHSTYFYAGDDKILIPGVASNVVNSMAEAKTYFDNGHGKVSLKFGLEEADNKNIEIGIDNKDTETDRWTIFRDFTLKYHGSAVDYSVYAQRWSEAVAAANTAKTNNAAVNFGAEYAALNAAIANAPTAESNKADYNTKINALTEATAAFTAAAPAYKPYLDMKEETIYLFGTDFAVDAPATTADVVRAVNELKVGQYNKVEADYPYSLSGKIGEFSTWTMTATSGGNDDTPQTNSNQHWSDVTHNYYEQGQNGWAAQSFEVGYSKTASLPAGDYVIKVATRASGNVTGTISASATENVVAIANVGAASKGITTDGVASFDDGTFANEGKGFGWEWRYLPFTLVEAAEVTINIQATSSSEHGWVSIADGELLSAEDIATAVSFNEANDNTISDVDVANVTMNRTIKKGFNTVVLPFDLTEAQVKAAFGTAAEVYAFSENSENANDITINFNRVTTGTITANVPVLVKATSASTEQTFNGVQIVASDNVKAAGTNFDFVGSYAPVAAIPAGDYFIGNDALFKSEGTTEMKAFRAYLQAKTAGVKSVSLFIEGIATGIEAIDEAAAENSAIFNLAGQRVQKAQRGLYIVNGKKVLVK